MNKDLDAVMKQWKTEPFYELIKFEVLQWPLYSFIRSALYSDLVRRFAFHQLDYKLIYYWTHLILIEFNISISIDKAAQ